MNQTANINKKLYSTLFNEGVERGVDSDMLITVYAFIKAAKQGKDRIRPITAKNGRVIKYYRLLHKVTKISEKTLKKYVPILESVGVFNFSKDGSAYLKGNTKTAKEFRTDKTIKLTVKDGIQSTKLNSFFVRIKAKEKRIKTAINKTNSKIKVLGKLESTKISFKEFKYAKRLKREGVTLKGLKEHHNKVVLSNEGFYKVKKEVEDSKSAGHYWKKKLVKAGKIKTRRNNVEVKKCSKADFLAVKYYNRKFSYYGGILWEETISEFTTTFFPKVEKKQVKQKYRKQEHLSFDMIDFWINM